MSYDLDEHRHRFSVWAAARAVQRGFSATTFALEKALEESGVRDFVAQNKVAQVSADQFDSWHRKCCPLIIDSLVRQGSGTVSYGRAAKLIAIYLKASVVLGPATETGLAHVAHPPIDRKLLGALTKNKMLLRKLGNINWTSLNDDQYYELVAGLRKALAPNEPFWKIEEWWKSTW